METEPTEQLEQTPAEAKQTAVKTTKTESTSLTLAEQAAGRVEAAAQLAESGSFGLILGARAEKKSEGSKESQTATAQTSISTTELTEDEKEEVERLKALDRQVKSNQAANGGSRSQSFIYETGPDGKRYVTGLKDEVSSQAKAETSPDQAVAEALKAETQIETAEAAAQAKKAHDGLYGLNSFSQAQESTGIAFKNGETLSQKAVKAYETVKNSLSSLARPALARV